MLVNFWATSCATCVRRCRRSSPRTKSSRRGFDTLAVAMSYDPPACCGALCRDPQVPFGVAIDNTGVVADRFGKVAMTPTTFLINKRGEIVKRYVGEPDFPALHKLIRH